MLLLTCESSTMFCAYSFLIGMVNWYPWANCFCAALFFSLKFITTFSFSSSVPIISRLESKLDRCTCTKVTLKLSERVNEIFVVCRFLLSFIEFGFVDGE